MKPEYEELLNNFERYLDSMSQTEFDSIVDSMAKERDNGESFGFDLSLVDYRCFQNEELKNKRQHEDKILSGKCDVTMHEDYERLYDELSVHREKPPQSNEYNPDDPIGLSSGRVTCTMATLVDPWDEATAEVFVQDENGNWIVDEESKNSRDMLIRSYRQWL